MIKLNCDLQIPVVVTTNKTRCDIYVPDFNITIHGKDFVEAMASTILKASSIYYYNLERNIAFDLNTTYAEAEALCKGRNTFATFATLTR